MTDKEVLLAFLSKTLNMDSSGVASLIYEEDGSELKSDALTIIESKEKERVSKYKGKFDEGHKAGTREALSKLEREFKEKTGFTSDAEGIDLFVQFADNQVSDAVMTLKPNELTEDDIRKHKLYLDLEKSITKTEKEYEKKLEEAVSGVKSQYQKEKMLGEINKRAVKQLMDMKPILSESEVKRENQLKLLRDELAGYEYQEREENDFILLKEGKVVEDDMRHPVTLEKFVSTAADKYYDFQASDNRSAPPKPNGSPSYKLVKPSSEKDFFDQYSKIQSDAKLSSDDKTKLSIELKKAYKGETVA